MEENQGISKKALIADDDERFRAMVANALEQAGFVVTQAIDGDDALQKARADKPDIILLDIMMPKKLGFEVLETVKADKELMHIPIITLSHLAQSSDTEKVKKLGAENHFVKTDFTIKDLIRKVKKYAGV